MKKPNIWKKLKEKQDILKINKEDSNKFSVIVSNENNNTLENLKNRLEVFAKNQNQTEKLGTLTFNAALLASVVGFCVLPSLSTAQILHLASIVIITVTSGIAKKQAQKQEENAQDAIESLDNEEAIVTVSVKKKGSKKAA